MHKTYAPPPFYKASFGGRILGLVCGVLAVADYDYNVLFFIVFVALGVLTDILIMNYYTPRRAQHLVNQRVSADVVALCAKMCKAKGRVEQEDITVCNQIFDLKPSARPIVAAIFNEERYSTQGFEKIAAQIVTGVGGHRSSLEMLMRALLRLALSKGRIHEKEQIFLLRVAEVFDLSFTRMTSLEQEVKASLNHGQQNTHWQKQNTARTHDSLSAAYKTLEVHFGASEADVKKAYRRLVAAHHPDRQHHKNPSSKARKAAEDKLAEINTAYRTILKK